MGYLAFYYTKHFGSFNRRLKGRMSPSHRPNLFLTVGHFFVATA